MRLFRIKLFGSFSMALLSSISSSSLYSSARSSGALSTSESLFPFFQSPSFIFDPTFPIFPRRTGQWHNKHLETHARERRPLSASALWSTRSAIHTGTTEDSSTCLFSRSTRTENGITYARVHARGHVDDRWDSSPAVGVPLSINSYLVIEDAFNRRLTIGYRQISPSRSIYFVGDHGRCRLR